MMKSSAFLKQPYGFTTNQISHAMFIGFLGFVYGTTLIYWYFTDQFPQKEWIIAFAGLAYIAYELIDQGWNRWDTVEDWFFVNVYGVWCPVLTFTADPTVKAGFTGDLLTPIVFVLLFVSHLGLGALWRWHQARKGE